MIRDNLKESTSNEVIIYEEFIHEEKQRNFIQQELNSTNSQKKYLRVYLKDRFSSSSISLIAKKIYTLHMCLAYALHLVLYLLLVYLLLPQNTS